MQRKHVFQAASAHHAYETKLMIGDDDDVMQQLADHAINPGFISDVQ